MTEHGPAHEPGVGDLLFPAINFLLFTALAWRLLHGPLREFFRSRTERIRDALTAGARARTEAAALRAEIARELEALPAARERLKADMRAAATREREAMLEHARRLSARLREDARLVAEQEAAMAARAVRMEVAAEAVRRAGEIVRGALTPADHERFVNEFVERAGAAA